MTYRPFITGDRVRNTTPRYAVPVGTLGTVVPGPASSHGATVLWDGYEMRESYGPDGWRPYWGTDQMEHADAPRITPPQEDAPGITVEPITPWTRDTTALDPSVEVRILRASDGTQWLARNVLGPGWWMHIYPLSGQSEHIGMASWENWTQVAALIEEFQAKSR